MAVKSSSFGLSGNQLKILAMLLMTIDHIGVHLLPQYRMLRVVGRLSMPIFAWMIAEGCYHTRSRFRYLLRLVLIAAVCQAVLLIFQDSLYMCILVTFSLSVILIWTVDLASRKQNFLTLMLMGLAFAGAAYICIFLPGDLPGTDFYVDYGFLGVLLPVLIYLGRNKPEKLMLAAAGLTALALTSVKIQWYGLLSLPLLALYNGKRGKHPMKYWFYLYYPLHLVVIFAISVFLAK